METTNFMEPVYDAFLEIMGIAAGILVELWRRAVKTFFLLLYPFKFLSRMFLEAGVVQGYKGFNKDMTCQGMRYKEGRLYVHMRYPMMCRRGFHFCRRLTDVFTYYGHVGVSVYHRVEAVGEVVDGDDKSCTDAIRIGRRLTRREIHDILVKENPGIDMSDELSMTVSLIMYFGGARDMDVRREYRPGPNAVVRRVNGRLKRISKGVPVWI